MPRNKRTQGVRHTDVRVGGVGQQFTRYYTIDGYTKNGVTSAIMAGVTVFLFRTDTKAYVSATTSDVNGHYSFTVDNNTVEYFLVAYLDGAPDLAGTSIKTVLAA
jgi:hypothetical protein